jgi:predicted alpha/beta-fold hydrolase
VVATYGITGSLTDQWFLQLLGRKAYARGYAVVLFDWRAHGKTAELSPTLTADGLKEGPDFVHIAAQAQALGCPAPLWLMGYSLGGQLALWGIHASTERERWRDLADDTGFDTDAIAGGVVICPSLDSERSLRYLMAHPLGRYLERAITANLKRLVAHLQHHHPEAFTTAETDRIDSIWGYDEALVVPQLGFNSVPDYYAASSPLPLLPHFQKPTMILYAEDDPLFDPTVVSDLRAACAANPTIDLHITRHGGHVAYLSGRRGQALAGDRDPWWAWNRALDWIDQRSPQFPVSAASTYAALP